MNKLCAACVELDRIASHRPLFAFCVALRTQFNSAYEKKNGIWQRLDHCAKSNLNTQKKKQRRELSTGFGSGHRQRCTLFVRACAKMMRR